MCANMFTLFTNNAPSGDARQLSRDQLEYPEDKSAKIRYSSCGSWQLEIFLKLNDYWLI